MNVYGRVQMMLWKARAAARSKFAATCQEHSVTAADLRLLLAKHRRFSSPFFWPSHRAAATAFDVAHEMAPYIKDPLHGMKKIGRQLLDLVSFFVLPATSVCPLARSVESTAWHAG